MTILADKQIAKLCELPKFVIVMSKIVLQKVIEDDVEVSKLTPVITKEFTSLDYETAQLYKPNNGANVIDIRELTEDEKVNCKAMIYPFTDYQVRFNVLADGTNEKLISYGLGPYSYDISLAPEFKVFNRSVTHECFGDPDDFIIDPKDFNDNVFETIVTDTCIVPPNGFVLGRSNEYFNMPPVITGILVSKSTYSRAGLNMFASVIQAGFCGNVVLEFANTTPYPIKLYANEGCAQVLFYRGDTASNSTYKDGKFQGQTGITLPFV